MILHVPFFLKFSCTVSFLTKTHAGAGINLSHFSEILKFSEHINSSHLEHEVTKSFFAVSTKTGTYRQ